MSPRGRPLPLFVSLLLVAGCGDGSSIPLSIHGPADELRLAVRVDEARTEAERVQGLTGYPDLPDDRGLLIVFPVLGEVCIQNGTVGFAIDEIYLDDNARVVAVEHDVAAGDGTLRCHLDTLYVLEVAAGVGATVAVGDGALF